MNTKSTQYDLEDRLIQFAVSVIDVVEILPSTKAGNHVGSQLIRCGTSPAPNYGETQSDESRIVLKELRETRMWLRIILRKKLLAPRDSAIMTLTECEELIRIFAKSAEVAESNVVRDAYPSIFDRSGASKRQTTEKVQYRIFNVGFPSWGRPL